MEGIKLIIGDRRIVSSTILAVIGPAGYFKRPYGTCQREEGYKVTIVGDKSEEQTGNIIMAS